MTHAAESDTPASKATDSTQNLFPQRLTWTQILLALLIVLLALGLRYGVLLQRLQADPSLLPEPGTDPYTYITQARGVLDGTFPQRPYYHHPGPTYVIAAVFSVTGSSLATLFMTVGLLDALSCGLLIGSGWLLTRKPAGGYTAGLIYAVYPLALFYSTTALITPQAVFWLSLLVFLALWQLERFSVWRTLLIGVVAGLLAISRLNLVPVAGLIALLWWLDAPRQWQQRLGHSTLFLLVMILTIAPVTYTNYRLSGEFIPVANTGPQELYRANNRDSAGRGSITAAFEHIDRAYNDALLRDIQLAPERFAGLLGYKFALFWNQVETSNNVTFAKSRERVPLLQLPLNFALLAAGGVFGLCLMLIQGRIRRERVLFLSVLLAWLCVSFLLVFAYGRLRHPAAVPLALGWGGMITAFWQIARGHSRQKLAQFTKQAALPAVLVIALLGFSSWVISNPPQLPPKRIYDDLPADAVTLNAHFNDEITLVGWRPLWPWPASEQGWVATFEAYGVELFWQINQPTDTDYQFYLAYMQDDTRYAALDRPIGAVSFPERTTDTWQPGTIHGEIVSVRLDDDVPTLLSGRVDVGVYVWNEAGRIQNVALNATQQAVTLQSLAVVPPAGASDVSQMPDLPDTNRTFGETITLRGFEMPSTAQPGETVTLRFIWEAAANLTTDYTLFVHLMQPDESALAAGRDVSPVPELQTLNWPPNRLLFSEITLTMPDAPGTYPLYIGLYAGDARLVTDAPDNRPLMGRIMVEASGS